MLEIDPSKIKQYPTRWWGQDLICDPRFVETAMGDGAILLGLQPLNTRPHYYLIRIDSSWHLQNCRICGDEDCPDELTEHLEDIYNAIEDEYDSRVHIEESNQELEDEQPQDSSWPVFDDEVGTSWFLANQEIYLTDAAYCLRAEVKNVRR